MRVRYRPEEPSFHERRASQLTRGVYLVMRGVGDWDLGKAARGTEQRISK